jgi:nucleoside-diphosphate-sugar epimerase
MSRHETSSPIAITGASGFLGTHLCTTLAARGVATRAILSTPGWQRAGVETVVARQDDGDALRRALEGVDTVVHLRGRAHVLRDASDDPATEFQRANVDGTRRLLDAALDAGVRRLVFMSSIGAVATTTDEEVSDVTPPRPDTLYGASKLEAEAVIRRVAADSSLEYVILRPPMVYGPGMKGNPLRLFSAVRKGIPLPLGGVRNRRSMIYVGNLVAAVTSALGVPAGTRETYVVGDSEPLSSAQLVREIARALGCPARLVTVPPSVLRAGGRLGDLVDRVVSFPVNSTSISRLCGSLEVDYSRFAQSTGYEPPYSRDGAMRATASWFLGRSEQ